MKLLLKCKIMKLALDFSVSKGGNVQDCIMRKRTEKIEGEKNITENEKDMSEVRGGRDESNNEEGQETRRHKIPGEEKVREDKCFLL